MYTYHEPLIGYIISSDYCGYFNQAIHHIVSEYDFTSPEDFKKETFLEYLAEYKEYEIGENEAPFDLECLDEDFEMLPLFCDWVEDNASYFTLKKEYHRGDKTPIALVFKNDSDYSDCYEDSVSYVLEISDIEMLLEDAKKFKLFCEKTMPSKLFKFIDDRGSFGIQYLNCSS